MKVIHTRLIEFKIKMYTIIITHKRIKLQLSCNFKYNSFYFYQ